MHYYEGNKEILLLPEDKDYPRFFASYGNVLLQVNRLDDAKAAFLNALEYDPVNTDVLVDLMLCYDHERNRGKVEETAKLILKYGYEPEAIAKSYRFLGYWHYNFEDYETSAALYLLSLVFEDNPAAKTDLCLINSHLPIKEINPISRLKEMNIQVGVNPVVLDILKSLHYEAVNNNHINIAGLLEDTIRELITPEELPKRLAILEDNYDEILNFITLD